VRPGIDITAERRLREQAGVGEQIDEQDLYPDVRPALEELRRRGVWIGIAGNQTVRAAQRLRGLNLPVDEIATSGEWGVAKPDPEFFHRVAAMAPGRPSEILYVGDHRDNDIQATHTAGIQAALIKRGLWGHLWSDDPIVEHGAAWIIDSLAELPELVRPATPQR
jgi:HAD superfamily hydrolase (TIGR01549 family)